MPQKDNLEQSKMILFLIFFSHAGWKGPGKGEHSASHKASPEITWVSRPSLSASVPPPVRGKRRHTLTTSRAVQKLDSLVKVLFAPSAPCL